MQRICVSGLTSSYGKKQVLNNISLEASAGTCTAIVGINGCGKSTLLNILAGLKKPDQGRIFFDGHEVNGRKEKELFCSYVGYVPQECNLVMELTVMDNLALWYQHRDELNQSLQEGFLHVLGLEQILSAKVGKLSGGMKKRVSMGCALAGNPPILLLDEPNAALDLPGKSDIRRYLAFYMEKGGTVIMATHDECDLELCNQVYCLSHGECHKIDNSLRGEALLRAIS